LMVERRLPATLVRIPVEERERPQDWDMQLSLPHDRIPGELMFVSPNMWVRHSGYWWCSCHWQCHHRSWSLMPPKRSLANAMGLISIMFDGLGWSTGNLIYVSARLLFSLWYIPGALSS
jgi:hypothetical protein